MAKAIAHPARYSICRHLLVVFLIPGVVKTFSL